MLKRIYTIVAFAAAFAVTSTDAAPLAPALAKRDGSIVMPAPRIIPSTWKQLGKTDMHSPYTFTMHLQHGDLAGLTARMERISAEGSGNWLTEEELLGHAQPSVEATSEVMSFLTSKGIPRSAITFNKYKDHVTVKTTVAKTASLFAAEFFDYTIHGARVARTKGYTIPSQIAPHVIDISPLAHFGSFRSHIANHKPDTVELGSEKDKEASEVSKRSTPSSCSNSKVTPQCLKDYYGTSQYTRSNGTASKPDVGVMAYIDQYVSQSDLTSFLKTYATSASGYQIPLHLRDGAINNASSPGKEAMLDVETVVSQIYPLTTAFYAEGNSSLAYGDLFAITFNDFLNKYSAANIPKIISISYGADEDHMTSSQATAMCNSAQKLTSLGTTIVVSSGDYGVAGEGDKCVPWTPTYPSGCPYILSVGGTQSFSPETMMSLSQSGYISGAGASNYFPIPSYQTSGAASYQKAIGTQNGDYSQKGRMYPDVAAQGSNYVIVVGGKSQLISGTSCAAPLTSSLLAMVNDERAKAGKGTIGWANPAIYANSLNDITSGGSYGCGSNATLGFPARIGYDGASGNGSPMFSALNKAFSVK